MSKRRHAAQKNNAGIDAQAYEPLGAAEELFYTHEREVLLAGPAGKRFQTGKNFSPACATALCRISRRWRNATRRILGIGLTCGPMRDSCAA